MRRIREGTDPVAPLVAQMADKAFICQRQRLDFPVFANVCMPVEAQIAIAADP
ncbi:hypothetical protein D3C72_2127780 [compost metagenome]